MAVFSDSPSDSHPPPPVLTNCRTFLLGSTEDSPTRRPISLHQIDCLPPARVAPIAALYPRVLCRSVLARETTTCAPRSWTVSLVEVRWSRPTERPRRTSGRRFCGPSPRGGRTPSGAASGCSSARGTQRRGAGCATTASSISRTCCSGTTSTPWSVLRRCGAGAKWSGSPAARP